MKEFSKTSLSCAAAMLSSSLFLAVPAMAADMDTTIRNESGISSDIPAAPTHTGSVLESANNTPKTGLEVEGALKAGTRDPVLTRADRLSLEGMSFRGSDANGDGKLSTSEFTKAGLSASVFGSVDKDHDGFVSRAELKAAGRSEVGGP